MEKNGKQKTIRLTMGQTIVVETSAKRYPPGSDMWWDVGVAEVSNDPLTRKLRRQYEQEVKDLQRFYY